MAVFFILPNRRSMFARQFTVFVFSSDSIKNFSKSVDEEGFI